ncbi:MAG: fused MFS/spermidine synthase, partial [Acidobacteria bacterium]|nr:fused MFS/spermidine synthase [Acidobacteriota bacterium]
MTAPHNPLPRRVLVAFMLSGVSALIYEMVWVRLLGDLFGHTAYAVQVVLAVFFGGVAFGSFLSDRLKADGRNLLKIYAAIEVVVGVAGLVFPLSVRLLTPLYDSYAPLELETGWALFFRLALATLLLIVPTALMGATLPLVIKWQSARDGRRGGVATLYAVNTLGGAFGAWATAFLLMPLLGVTYTLAAAALGNLIAALLALSARETKRERTAGASPTEIEFVVATETSNQAETPRAPAGLTALLLFLTGFIAISLEVLWTRALDQVLSGTIYSFATVLAVFLLGIALGSWLYRRFLKPLHPFKVFVVVETVLANYVVASLILVYFTTAVSERLGARLGLGFVRRGVLLESLVSAFILLVPALCMGVLFPLLLDAARGRAPHGYSVGSLVAANTVGSVLGPIAAGFFLLPWLGLRGSLLVMACLCLGLALVASSLFVRRAQTWAVVGVGMALMLTLFLIAPSEVRVWGKPGERLFDFREDPAATVSVVDSGGAARERRLKVNNTYSLGGGRGVFTERRQGHLPMLLHPSPERVLVLGVGTGNTLGAVSLHRPERLLAAELIPGVLELAKKHFAATNYRVLENARAQVITADALRVARATPEKYDVVIADLFHPWQAGVGSLYSREHFTAVRRALADGGVFCQWLPLYQLSEENLKTIIRTFVGVYPEAGAWLGNFGTGTPILALVGSERPV